MGWIRRWPALAALTMLAACAVSRSELTPPSASMIEAVEAATAQSRISLDNADLVQGPMAAGSNGPIEGINFVGGRTGFALPCTTTTASVLEAAGFAPASIASVWYTSRITVLPTDANQVSGFRAWVTFDDQAGYLLINVRTNCEFLGAMPRYGVKLPSSA